MYLPLYNRWITVIKEGDRWKCIRCGKCCRTYAVELNSEDLRELPSSEIEILEDGRKRLKRKGDGSCIFYDAGRRECRIYERRPDSCRTFPFSIITKETAEKIGIKFEENELVSYRGRLFLLLFDELCTALGNGDVIKRKKVVEECYRVALKFGFRF
ncbi:MAG: uncharacterized protein PWR13_736 [Archaeoglobi archaeon]|nr:uncharacterized protein [Archaeoglobi archaeon]MDK2781708.1 uncharacterized protein [Archaeoglobi archaeon]